MKTRLKNVKLTHNSTPEGTSKVRDMILFIGDQLTGKGDQLTGGHGRQDGGH